MGWAQPSRARPRFTDVHCTLVRAPSSALPEPNDVDDRCTFHESGPHRGNPDSFWDVHLRHIGSRWLIDSYGQG
jgi:hypothetical protein